MTSHDCASLILTLIILLMSIVFAASDASLDSESLFGVQTGDDRMFLGSSSYAVSMVYNDYNKELVITGGTYGSFFRPANGGETRNQSSMLSS